MPELLDDAELPKDSNGNTIQLHDWEDFDGSRNQIFDTIKTTMEKQFANKEHNGVRLSINNLNYVDPESYSLSEQKKILHEDGFLSRRLRGTATLTDSKTGQILDQKDLTLMKVPYLTGRGTFIRSGNEWGTINQTRLIPGAYSRFQNNGDLETQFNVRPGTGGAFKVTFNPESAVYKFKTAGQEFHMYSLLHEIGISDEQLRSSWGDDIFEKNKEGFDNRTLEKAYQKIVPEWDRKQNPGRSRQDKVTLIKNALNRAQMASAVAKRTLPNLFDRTKSASWQQAGDMLVKIANLNTEEIKDVATYINEAMDKTIDIEQSKDAIETDIKSVITTGLLPEQAAIKGIDSSDNAAQLVRAIKQQRAFKGLQNKLNKQYGY